MSLTSCYYRLLSGGCQRYAEYSIRMLAILVLGVCLLIMLAWLSMLGADESNSAPLRAGRLNSGEASLARNAAQHAWRQYRRHSWGANELAPGSMTPSRATDSLVGSRSGLTIVEGLTTLHLMGLNEEFLQAQEWIDTSFDFTNTTDSVSTSETSARLLGGLLSAFSMTEHPPFLYKALQVAEGLLVAFDTPSGLPASVVVPFQSPTAAGRFIRLDQMARLYLEFAFLHRLTELKKYADAAAAILAPLTRHLTAWTAATKERSGAAAATTNNTSDHATWTPPSAWDVRTGAPTAELVDSSQRMSGLLTLVEVAIKAHLLLDGDRKALRLFQGLLSGRLRLDAWLNCRPGEANCRFNLTACRLVETLLLSLGHSRDPIVQRDLAHQLGDLCLSTMQIGELNLASDQMLLRRSPLTTANGGFQLTEASDTHYAAQPEPVLAGLLLWSRRRRMQHQELLSLTLHSIAQRMQGPSGYQGFRRVTRISSGQHKLQQEMQPDNRQPSYLLGQTLKYIYMAFEPNRLNLVSGEWVFNTVGQLLPVCSGPKFDGLRIVVRNNWPEVRRQLGDLVRLRLARRRNGLGDDYDGLSSAGSAKSRGLILWLAAAAAVLPAVV